MVQFSEKGFDVVDSRYGGGPKSHLKFNLDFTRTYVDDSGKNGLLERFRLLMALELRSIHPKGGWYATTEVPKCEHLLPDFRLMRERHGIKIGCLFSGEKEEGPELAFTVEHPPQPKELVPRENQVLVIEDVLRTGRSVMAYTEELHRHSLNCTHVLAGIDRQMGGTEALQKRGIEVINLLTAEEILEEYLTESILNATEERIARDELGLIRQFRAHWVKEHLG